MQLNILKGQGFGSAFFIEKQQTGIQRRFYCPTGNILHSMENIVVQTGIKPDSTGIKHETMGIKLFQPVKRQSKTGRITSRITLSFR
ncbi:hypothetical protein [Mesobacillus jeotgali]|uniref:hypothetical protein n=1 Tax=Mesobacillus jeotgali TaxID=129985 RepID=UPI0009A8C775|nr:hypothetical protein [Mesobacillus jeotgali]